MQIQRKDLRNYLFHGCTVVNAAGGEYVIKSIEDKTIYYISGGFGYIRGIKTIKSYAIPSNYKSFAIGSWVKLKNTFTRNFPDWEANKNKWCQIYSIASNNDLPIRIKYVNKDYDCGWITIDCIAAYNPYGQGEIEVIDDIKETQAIKAITYASASNAIYNDSLSVFSKYVPPSENKNFSEKLRINKLTKEQNIVLRMDK